MTFAGGALVLGFAAGLAAGLLARGPTKARTVTTSTVEVIDGSRLAGRRPARIPTLLEGGADPHGLALDDAVPVDAHLDSADYVMRQPHQLIVTWDRAHLTHDHQAAIWQRRGVAIWQLDRGSRGTWHRAYTYETLVNNQVGVEGFGISVGDVSGDRRPEVLIWFDTDGSAGGGTFHLFVNVGRRVREVFVKSLALDQGTIAFGKHALVMREGVDYRGPGIHCCYRKVRLSWLRWDGRHMVMVRKYVRKNRRGWPPG